LYWMLVLNGMFSYGAVNGFLNIGNNYIQQRFGFTKTGAGNILTIYYGISMFLTPVFGYIADKFGKRLKLIFVANVLLVIGNVVLVFLPDCDDCYTILIPICVMGVFISIYSATFWGSIPLVVEKKVLGTAFGLTYSLQNTSWAILPLIVGSIQDYGYVYVSILLLGIASTGTLLTLVAEVLDRKMGRNLEKVYQE